MFKSLRNGNRSATGSPRTGRVSSTRMGHGRDTTQEQSRLPAFVPPPTEHGRDSSLSRVSEVNGGKGGYTGKNVGAS